MNMVGENAVVKSHVIQITNVIHVGYTGTPAVIAVKMKRIRSKEALKEK